MSLLVVQFLLLCSFIPLATMPFLFAVFGANYLVTGKHGRATLMTGLFIMSALLSGFLVWQTVPSEWKLPFWETMKATVDAENYGDAAEHYAEGILLMMSFAAVLGGAFCSAGVALGSKLFRKHARP